MIGKRASALFLSILATSLTLIASTRNPDSYTQLKAGFSNPPDESRPRVWWHWMNGNITRDGLRKDMDWMYRSGVRGFHVFDANFDTPLMVDHRVEFFSDEWKSIFREVISRADSLGMEVTIASSPGFSSSGGPWVTAEDGMKKLCWRNVDVEGGRKLEIALPEPYAVTGAYQNIPNDNINSYYRDIAVLAVKIPEAEKSLAELGASVTSSSGNFTVEMLTDGDFTNGDSLKAEPEGYSWIQYSFPEPVTVRAVTMLNGKARSERHSYPADCIDSLQVSDDGVTFRTVAGIPIGSCIVQTFDLEPVSSRYFRLKHMNVPDTYYYVTDTWTPAPESTRIEEFALHTVTKVNHSQEKAGFGSAHDLRLFPTPEVEKEQCSSPAIDLSQYVQDGILKWEAPQGRWRIIRLGCSLTGKENHPASESATGLEVDKLDPDAWRRYFHNYLDLMKEAAGGLMGQRGIQYVLTDSYEAQFQNWTPKMREQFLARRGYDCLPWMPALTGVIIGSSAETEQFLFDWRTTLGELFCENYALLTDIVCNEYGMKGCYVEAHANGSVFPADGMSVKKRAAFPMGEMWIQGKVSTSYRTSEGMADIRESASVANIYGQKYVAAESMTAIGLSQQAWTYCPENMKRTADLEMKAGVNRFVLHDSAAQPCDDKFPGVGLGVYGHWFNRHECWAETAWAWIDYLSRSSYMLSQGKNVADVLWYFGEETNITSYYSRSFPEIPRGYEFDFCGADALLNEIICENGVLRSISSEAQYHILYVDPHITYMSDKVRQKLSELERAGAVICGPGQSLESALNEACIAPDVSYEGPENLNYKHRSTAEGIEIYWVENPSYEVVNKQVSFRLSGKIPHVWHPENALVEKIDYEEKDGRTYIDLEFESDDAFFIVFSDEADTDASIPVKTNSSISINGPWQLEFQKDRGAPEKGIRLKELKSLTEMSDPGVRYFSGTVSYRTRFNVKDAKNVVELDLGEVKNIAEAILNGKNLGVVWKTPFVLNVEDVIRKGINTLEIRITNTWPNRLIGDAQADTEHPITYTAFKFYKAEDTLLPSGLLGPVTLRTK